MYVAIINTPGYLPDSEDPPVFERSTDAWQHLAEERREHEDETGDYQGGDPYSETVDELDVQSQAKDSPGVLYGPTPGYEGDHDLGLAYTVQEVRQ
jgi:hypothetical protein